VTPEPGTPALVTAELLALSVIRSKIYQRM
jgi:hypothetical protein